VGADLENLCREAGMMAYRRNPDANTVSQRDFLDAMKNIRPSVDEEVLKFYKNLSENMGKNVKERRKSVDELGLYQ